MQAVVAQALRACSRTLPAKSLASRVALFVPRRVFSVAPSYKSRVAVAFRGYATAAATKKPAAKKPAAKKTAATTTKKKTTRKKAVATKTTAKSKPKARATKKKATKPKPKPKPKKKTVELSPEQKARVKKRELRKNALVSEQPKKLPFTSWLVYTKSQSANRTRDQELGSLMKEIAASFKKLSASELERLQEEASQNSITNAVNLKKWVESYPVDVISRASRARAKLARAHKLRVLPMRIPDERKMKRPASAFAMYIHAHIHDSTISGSSSPDKIRTLAGQWKNLGAAEKKAFTDLAAAERVKFAQEVAQA